MSILPKAIVVVLVIVSTGVFFYDAEANTHGISQPVIKSVILIESSGNPRAKSSAGAYGLMQVLGAHAGTVLCPEASSEEDLYDPEINIKCGTRILRYELDRYGDNLELALGAYNGGPKCVKKGKIICPAARTYSAKVLQTLARQFS